ncbi:MAG: hypothetical protein IKH57_08195 [Clostridia bacterium]|nr:hypothetical protein [Clostridia bacterium]
MRTSLKTRLLAFLITCLLLSTAVNQASAYIPCQCNNPPDQCTCFIQLGDKSLAVEKSSVYCGIRDT